MQGGLRGGFGHIAVNTPDVYKFSDALDKVQWRDRLCERMGRGGGGRGYLHLSCIRILAPELIITVNELTALTATPTRDTHMH